MDLKTILTALRQWLPGVPLPAQVLTDRDDALRVIFETENALAELIASDGAYTPCRFVSFTVLDTRLDLPAEPVFCFHDNDSHTVEDILRALDRGMAHIAGMH